MGTINVSHYKLWQLPLVVIGLIFLMVAVLLIPSHKAAAVSPFELCTNTGVVLCAEVTRFSPPIDAIMEPDLAGGYQRVYETGVNECNGTDYVTTTCPFTVGYGMNTDFVGDQIVEFHFNQNPNYCLVSSNLDFSASVLPCGSNGTYWVNDYKNEYCQGGDLASVFQSNRALEPELLTSPGSTGSTLQTITCGYGLGGPNSWQAIYK